MRSVEPPAFLEAVTARPGRRSTSASGYLAEPLVRPAHRRAPAARPGCRFEGRPARPRASPADAADLMARDQRGRGSHGKPSASVRARSVSTHQSVPPPRCAGDSRHGPVPSRPERPTVAGHHPQGSTGIRAPDAASSRRAAARRAARVQSREPRHEFGCRIGQGRDAEPGGVMKGVPRRPADNGAVPGVTARTPALRSSREDPRYGTVRGAAGTSATAPGPVFAHRRQTEVSRNRTSPAAERPEPR